MMDDNTEKEDKLTPQDPPKTTTGSNVKNSETDTYKKLYETSTKKGTNDPLPMDEEASKTSDTPSPKRNKKLKTERDPNHTRERTRSKSRNSRIPPSDHTK
jgi:hypothetical protein